MAWRLGSLHASTNSSGMASGSLRVRWAPVGWCSRKAPGAWRPLLVLRTACSEGLASGLCERKPHRGTERNKTGCVWSADRRWRGVRCLQHARRSVAHATDGYDADRMFHGSPKLADSPQAVAPASRFRLLHDVEEIVTWTWGGARTAFALPTLTYLLPAAAVVGGARFADDAVQAHFQGHDKDDALTRAGQTYALLYFGPAQVGLYIAGELSDDTKL